MANILVNSKEDSRQIKDLLSKSLPSYRQAYSDRTAWLMACLSELAYVKFNPSNIDRKTQRISPEKYIGIFGWEKENYIT